MSDLLGYREIEDKLRNHILHELTYHPPIQRINEVIIESLDLDNWGNVPIYEVTGHVLLQVKTGVFSKTPYRKTFSGKVDARDGKILTLNWVPGEPLK
jgi:hypothetical protein